MISAVFCWSEFRGDARRKDADGSTVPRYSARTGGTPEDIRQAVQKPLAAGGQAAGQTAQRSSNNNQ